MGAEVWLVFVFFLIYLFLIGGKLLYSVGLGSVIHQHESVTGHTYVPSLLKLPPTSHPIPLLRAVTEHWVQLLTLYSKFPLALCFTSDNAYVSMLLSQFVSPSPSLRSGGMVFEGGKTHVM